MLKIRIYRKRNVDESGNFISESIELFSLNAKLWKGRPDAGVNLGRRGTNPKCNTKLTNLVSHNHESPTFLARSEADAYIRRVINDIKQWSTSSRTETVC